MRGARRQREQGGLPRVRHNGVARGVKRGIDMLVAALGLVCLAPLLIGMALLVKASGPGPVFFRQRREGWGGRAFELLKFRSMRTDLGDRSGLAQTVDDDPRITAIGRFMRKYSIDELPQLINVLKGEMSLVGPRPHVAGMLAGGIEYRQLVPYYEARHAMLPGLTGWAQVNGLRGPTADPAAAVARIDHDIAYVQNWSLRLDMRILMLTLKRELSGGTGS